MYLLFFFRSLHLDIQTLWLPMSTAGKFELIWKKYIVLVKNFSGSLRVGKSYATVFSKKYFFDDKFGLAFLQSVYVDHAFLHKFIKRNSFIIDIGANIGQFNFFCKHFLVARKVISFEPIPQTYTILVKNTNQKDSYQKAVSTKHKLTFYLPDLSLMASAFQVDKRDVKLIVEGIKPSQIGSVRKAKEIDLLKIDVEGAELDALRACEDILGKVKFLLIEASVLRSSSGDIGALFAFLEKSYKSYRLFQIGRIHRSKGKISDLDLLFVNTALINNE